MRWLVAALLLLSSCSQRHYHTKLFPAGPPTPDTLLRTWLEKSCSAGEGRQLEREILRQRASLFDGFKTAYENGPPPELSNALGKHSRELVEELRRQAPFLGLSGEEEARIARLDTDSYVRQALADFRASYQSAALAGLRLINTRKSRDYLRQRRGASTP